MLDSAIETEVSMEKIRQQLKARPDFDNGQAFLTLLAYQRTNADYDTESAGAYGPGGIPKYVTIRDLECLMRRHDHLADLSIGDMELLISRFDRDGDGRISVNEFFEQIEPHSHRVYYKPE
jgi:hypothetical protein